MSEAELALNWELVFGGYRIDPDVPAVISGFDPLPEPEVREGDSYEVQTRRWPGA